jgi:hypothetical protein
MTTAAPTSSAPEGRSPSVSAAAAIPNTGTSRVKGATAAVG